MNSYDTLGVVLVVFIIGLAIWSVLYDGEK